jgi:hypothetical protein
MWPLTIDFEEEFGWNFIIHPTKYQVLETPINVNFQEKSMVFKFEIFVRLTFVPVIASSGSWCHLAFTLTCCNSPTYLLVAAPKRCPESTSFMLMRTKMLSWENCPRWKLRDADAPKLIFDLTRVLDVQWHYFRRIPYYTFNFNDVFPSLRLNYPHLRLQQFNVRISFVFKFSKPKTTNDLFKVLTFK